MRHPFIRTLAGQKDPYFKNTTLLLHGDGTNGGQNNTFVDGSTNNFTITRNGNTTQGTFSPYGDNWSNYFDGTDDYLSIADNVNLRPGSGAFTIEAWVYRFATGRHDTIYAKGGASTGIVLSIVNAGNLRFAHSASNFDSTGTIGPGVWTHVAVVREGTGTNQTKLYINGVQDGQGTVSTDFTQTEEARIGTNRTSGDDFGGYISNLRFVKGTAVYTGAFTVPTAPLTAISNTQLLTCQSNRFRDASTNNFAITSNGNVVSVQRFSPFSPTAAYAAGTIGGSGYFDGTGDNLSISSATGLCDFAAGQAFTFQVWLYRLGTGSMIFIQGGANTFQVTITSSGGGWTYGKSGVSDLFFGVGAAPLGAWTHCTLCRDTSNRTRMWINGVSVASSTSDTFAFNTAATYIGSNNTSSSAFVQGYLSDMRILKGQALYDPTSSANIEVPTAPLSAVTNTSFLLNFQNAAILDNAMACALETVGNVQISTSVKKYGTGSMYFDGTGDWMFAPDTIDQRIGVANFTIECWLYLASTGAARGIVNKGGNTTGWALSVNATNNVVFTYDSSTITSTGTLSGSTWYHIAVVREGTGTNQTKIYIDGTNDGTGTVTSGFTQSERTRIGSNRSGGDPMNGYIDDLRITKGVARYTANFIPPTAPFPDF